jgi:hypothetical protein
VRKLRFWRPSPLVGLVRKVVPFPAGGLLIISHLFFQPPLACQSTAWENRYSTGAMRRPSAQTAGAGGSLQASRCHLPLRPTVAVQGASMSAGRGGGTLAEYVLEDAIRKETIFIIRSSEWSDWSHPRVGRGLQRHLPDGHSQLRSGRGVWAVRWVCDRMRSPMLPFFALGNAPGAGYDAPSNAGCGLPIV